MSTYIKDNQPLEYDNAPDWLVAHLRYRRTMMGNTKASIMTYFIALREFLQWVWYSQVKGIPPRTEADIRNFDILDMPITAPLACGRAEIEAYMYFLEDALGNSTDTRAKKLTILRSFYFYLFDQQKALGITLVSNPADRIRLPKQPKKTPVYLPAAERQQFLDAIGGENGVRDYAIFLLILSCGLRISEAVGIDLGDLNLTARTIRISGKGNKQRIANLSENCADAIQRYLIEYRGLIPSEAIVDRDALFLSARKGRRLTTRSLELAMRNYVIKAGLGGQGYTPHKLRHTTATMLAKDGVDLLVIQEVLGHANPATTEIYTHIGNDDVLNALANSSLSRLGD